MASEGPNNPDVVADDGAVGNTEWSDPENAISSDDNAAVATTSLTEQSHYLKATDFDFTLEEDPTEIVVEIERRKSGGDVGDTIKDAVVRLVVGGVVVGDNLADTVNDWPASDTYKTYTFTNSLPTAAQLQAVDFGVVLSVNFNIPSAITMQAHVDHVRITANAEAASQTATMTGSRLVSSAVLQGGLVQ